MIQYRLAVLTLCAIWLVVCSLGFAHELPFQGQLSAEEVVTALTDDGWVVVDARSTHAYNGWALDGMGQGGHIPGAVDFPADWLQLEIPQRADKLKDILLQKKISPGKKVVVYSARAEDRQRVADFLREQDYNELYAHDLHDWLTSKRELRRYPWYQKILPPAIVKQLLDGEMPETFEKAQRVVFVEASWGDEDASYASGHVPSSFHVNTDHFEPPPTWYLGKPEVLSKFAADYGFHADDTVIISGEDVMACFRLAVVLEYMGVADVRVLNGGLAAWQRAGYPVETKRHSPPESNGFGVKLPRNPALILSSEAVKGKLLNQDKFTLVDTRTWAEFVGEKSGYTYHSHKGRIPGSVYGQADYQGPDSLVPYRNIDGTMRNPDEILALWKAAGIDTNQPLCFMCGGGWRAAEVLTYARIAGLERTNLYSDGWIGWSNSPGNPVEIGPPK